MFDWTCPHCGAEQTEYYEPDLGPSRALLCSECNQESDETTLSEQDAAAWFTSMSDRQA